MFAVVCVLLVACANVASLLLARASMRTKEAGLRVAMGGSRLRVMLPFFAEAFVLAAAGALLGVLIAWIGVGWFDDVTSPARTGRPSYMLFQIDTPILLFVVAIAVLTAFIAGVAPAYQMSRTDVSTILKDEARGSSGLLVGRLTRGLVVVEVALSVALLVGAGLMTKSIVNVGRTTYPFETRSVFTARVGLFPSDYPEVQDRQRFWAELSEELRALPDASAAGLSEYLPYDGRNELPIAVVGQTYVEPAERPEMNRTVVSPGLFGALGVEMVDGRDFSVGDDMDAERVAIVNQPMVDRLFGGANAVGRQLREGLADTLPPLTIVGVVPDLHMAGLQFAGEENDPAGYYVPIGQEDRQFMSVAVLTRSGNAMGLTGDVRAAVRRVDADLPIYEVFSQAEVVDRQVWFFQVFGTVFIVFGAAALFMATVGLYGVLSFAVSRRTQEMGIRMALGAASRDVVGLVARQGARQLGIGVTIGLLLAFGVTRVIGLLMYQVDPQDPTVFGAVLAVIVVVGMSAAIVPARRATGVDPVTALRAE
jgi:predicted permease